MWGFRAIQEAEAALLASERMEEALLQHMGNNARRYDADPRAVLELEIATASHDATTRERAVA
jgi:hypothetical protein